MNRNKDSTRFYSDKHEKSICKLLSANQTLNSGANKFKKGDCIQEEASLLVECKTCMSDKSSFSIKKDWIEKNKQEAFQNRLYNSCIAFNYGPDQESYFVIDSKLMKYLVEKLIEENS